MQTELLRVNDMETVLFDFNAFHEYFLKNDGAGFIYAVQYEDGIVKIGCTADFDKRINQLAKIYRGKFVQITKIHVSGLVEHKKDKEQTVLRRFKPCLKNHKECFDISFEDAVSCIDECCCNEPTIHIEDLNKIADYYPNVISSELWWELYRKRLDKAIQEFEIETNCGGITT